MTAEPQSNPPAASSQSNPPAEPLPAAEPAFRITAGHPTADELAAVTALLLAISRSRAAGGQPAQPIGGWADPALRLRRPLPPGPGAWRASVWT